MIHNLRIRGFDGMLTTMYSPTPYKDFMTISNAFHILGYEVLTTVTENTETLTVYDVTRKLEVTYYRTPQDGE